MKRTYELYLHDIVEAISRITAYTEGMSQDQLRADTKTLDATIHNLQIIGEAVSRLPVELTTRHPDVPWAQIKAFRNIVVHTYWNVDMHVLWDILHDELEPLRAKVSEMLRAEAKE